MPKLFALLSKPAFLLLLLVVVGGSGVYMYTKYKATTLELDKFKTDPQSIAAEEAQNLIADVGNLTNLPANEQPTVATVTNVDALRDQAFFAQAENGDKVLIYTEAKRTILYRPSTKKIIEIAPLNIGAQTTTEEAPTEEVAGDLTSVTLAVYNGTKTAGLASKVADRLKTEMPDLISTTSVGNTQADYEKTIVVDLSGSGTQDAQKVADFLGASVAQLPGGETKPETDILVILGSDYQE